MELNKKVMNFTLKDENNNDVNLYDLNYDYIVLYFYPKDDTKGCTIEALLYKEYIEKFKELNVKIIGISKDSVSSHEKFKCKYELPFTLLSDENMDVIKYFEAYGEKNMYGKISLGIIRKTVILNNKFELIKEYKKAISKDNAKRVYEFIKEHKNQG